MTYVFKKRTFNETFFVGSEMPSTLRHGSVAGQS